MNNEKQLICWQLIAFTMLLWLPYAAKADILRVKQDGTGDYVLIADALSAANTGDTVLIYPGEYFENLFVSDKQLVIAGASLVDGGPVMTRQTIINGGGNSTCLRLLRMAAGTEISRLTFKNGHSAYLGGIEYDFGAGITLGQSTVVISDCVITENYAYRSGGGGICVVALCHLTLSGCSIYNNKATASGGGILAGGNSTVVFDSINRNSIYMNYASLGADMNLSKTFAVVDDTIKLDTITVAGFNHHYIRRSGTSGEIDYSFQVLPNAHVLDLKDGPLYVSPSGSDENDGLSPENPMKSIRWALYNLRCDTDHTGRIILDEGLYSTSATGEIYPLFIKNNTSIEGSTTGQSVIDCELEESIINSGDTTTRLIAFSNLDIKNFYHEQSGLGGRSFVYFTTSDRVTFVNLSFHGVTNISSAPGMIFNAVDSLFVRKTRFYDIRLARGTIVNNWLLTNQQCFGLFESVVFNNNYSICCPYEPDLRFLRAIQAGGLGMTLHFINSEISDNIDSSNTTLYVTGGMSISDRAKAWVVNSTIGGNISTSPLGAAIGLVDGAEVRFINSIIYGNTPNQMFSIRGENNLPNTLHFSHSVLQGGAEAILTDGPGHSIFFDETNITTDPQWVGYGTYPYALSGFSPCIDAGTLDLPEGIVLPDKDLAGQPRMYGGMVDMGAYEFNPVGLEPIRPEEPQEKKMLIVSPNPVKDGLLITYQIQDAGYLSIEAYNQLGRMVKKLVDRNETAGKGSFYWNLLDDTGNRISKGTYFIKLKLNNTETSEKMVVM
ncbi:MAG: DUF1565 domain-containing protein [Bacteroidetes bacterium]|nr:DUF1565 domain-containing protein [Bacteroidota bacterium]